MKKLFYINNFVSKSEVTLCVVVITTAVHSTKRELRIFASSNSARGMSDIRYGEDL